jgi:tRNA dimethylallyltransferase
VPHHLIDLVDPATAYSAARFVADAMRAIGDPRARPAAAAGRRHDAVLQGAGDGLDALPPADPALRARSTPGARTGLAGAARASWRASTRSPRRGSNAGDAQRIQRALEVHRAHRRPMSALADARGGAEARRGAVRGGERHAGAGRAADGDAGPALLRIALEPSDRAVLHARIAERFEAMLAAGLSTRCARCAPRRPVRTAVDALRRLSAGVGLARCGRRPARERRPIEAGIAATRQLAKRQLTWLRAMPASPSSSTASTSVGGCPPPLACHRLGVVPQRVVYVHSPERAEMRATQRATADSRVGTVSLSVCRPSSCMYRRFRLHSSFCSSIMAPTSRVIDASFGKMPTTRCAA